ncbi:MAG: energy transducer TonB, partial [Gammaproteobacteria bacterium]|nr:energy transducer TonB [Gammaproteobacteria bacterium]
RKRAAKASLPARSTPAAVANPSASADTVTASLSSSANADRSDKARAPDPGGEQSVAPKPPPAPPPSRAHGERYLSEIARLLDRSKRYPLQARRRHHEGVVAMRFVIDRDGKLLEHSIQRSSGSGLLDDAARELIASVAPYPPPPRGIGSMPIELVVPIQYRLSR